MDILIRIADVTAIEGQIYIAAIVQADGVEGLFGCSAYPSMNLTSTQINAAIKDAAVQIMADNGHTVSISDKKTLFGAASGL